MFKIKSYDSSSGTQQAKNASVRLFLLISRILVQLLWSMISRVRAPSYLDKPSFNNVENWISDARAVRGNDVVILLVGNKVDLA